MQRSTISPNSRLSTQIPIAPVIVEPDLCRYTIYRKPVWRSLKVRSRLIRKGPGLMTDREQRVGKPSPKFPRNHPVKRKWNGSAMSVYLR